MHSIEIMETDTVLEFPASALELTREQLLSFSSRYLAYAEGQISFTAFKTALVYDFLGLLRTADLAQPESMELVRNISDIGNMLNAFFDHKTEKGQSQKVLKMNFYRQLIPNVQVGKTVFYGPSDALFNTVWGEYLQALTLFNDFAASGDEHYLNMLIATLYRPKKRDIRPEIQDKRVAFNEKFTEYYAGKLSNLAPHYKNAIFLYFASSKHFLENNDALDIGGGITIDISQLYVKDKTVATVKGLGMVGTTFSIAEGKVFGNMKEVAKQGTIDILAYLVDQHQKMQELKKKKKK